MGLTIFHDPKHSPTMAVEVRSVIVTAELNGVHATPSFEVKPVTLLPLRTSRTQPGMARPERVVLMMLEALVVVR